MRLYFFKGTLKIREDKTSYGLGWKGLTTSLFLMRLVFLHVYLIYVLYMRNDNVLCSIINWLTKNRCDTIKIPQILIIEFFTHIGTSSFRVKVCRKQAYVRLLRPLDRGGEHVTTLTCTMYLFEPQSDTVNEIIISLWFLIFSGSSHMFNVKPEIYQTISNFLSFMEPINENPHHNDILSNNLKHFLFHIWYTTCKND